MTEPGKYETSLDALERSARVPLDEQVEEVEATQPAPDDDAAGHLPGHVRPYGV